MRAVGIVNFIVGCVRVCGVRVRGALYERLPVYMPRCLRLSAPTYLREPLGRPVEGGGNDLRPGRRALVCTMHVEDGAPRLPRRGAR